VDEEQHFSRPCDCEQIRMVNITYALGKACVFIRYNPDKYKDVDTGKKIEGESFTKRMERLAYYVKYYQNYYPEYTTIAIYLYFDGWLNETPPVGIIGHPMPPMI
jgi:hypothetical protein